MAELLNPIGLCGVSIVLSLFLISCQGSNADQPPSGSVTVQRGDQRIDQYTRPPVDTVVAFTPQKDSIPAKPPSPSPKQVQAKKTSTDLPKVSKEPRRFYTMPPRTVDSLIATFDAVNRLHPEDRALFDRAYSTGKEPNPVLDPKTGKTLPFPYAFPSRYGADIRRLDSIKAADSLRKKQ